MEFLLGELEDISNDWKRRLHEYIVILEQVYAVELDRGSREVDAEGQQFVAEATNGIETCLEEVEALCASDK